MDILAHALYGVTLFSRTGLAGGASGNCRTRSWVFDWTVWAAVAFALLPDTLSIGVEMLAAFIHGNLFTYARVPEYVLILYQWTHNLLVAGAVSLLVRLLWKSLFMPALAWPLHILLDIFTHGPGRWNTPPLLPLSDFTLHGINWWRHPWVMIVYWSILIILWVAIHLWRRRAAANVHPTQVVAR